MAITAPVEPTGHPLGRWRRRHLPWAVAVVLWIVVAALIVVAAMRLLAWDALEPFAILNDVTAFVYLPAWIVAAVALVWWRPVLLAVSILVVVAQVAFMLPELTAAQSVPSWAASAPSFRLLQANVYFLNPSMAGYAAQIKAERPDLITMEEAVPNLVAQLTQDGGLAGLPYREYIQRDDSKALLVASKYPLSGDNVVYDDHLPLITQTTVHLPSGPQPLWVVHTTAPLPSTFAQWRGQLALVGRLLRTRGPNGLLMVGDFNATWGSQGFRAILDAGMTDAGAARGMWFDMTWSQLERPLPPLVRIDHVLTGSGVAVTAIRTGPGPGSDHRDLLAQVAVRRR
jgi:endonuclease/exonuclease/phosphatase (EEP) superfamily protein YafD